MADFAKEILPVNLEDEMEKSYLDYAMSVIIGRALPDARDGLKPVHRRVLYAMNELGNDWNKAYKKSARVVGDVIGKYHPHGDVAVYDTIVRMAQPFSMRYLLVDGQGNFGSVDGDSPAAMRYTEVRMSRMAHELLADLDKETVDFVPNYDETESEPAVFPTRVPHLLVNGAAGIAVGMATNIPPHNLGEIIDGCLGVIDNAAITLPELMELIPGPDFPTAGFINGAEGIREAYETGRGRIYLRARHQFETDPANGRESIVVTELPYQVNKARLLEKIAELVKEKKIEGIVELRDESDKDGMRMVIELRRGEVAEVVLNNLFQHTQMQNVYGINMVALLDGMPQLMNLKQLLEAFIQHRRDVVTRRTIFDLRKARERAHILEGLAVALANIDPVIALIKQSPNPAEAKRGLVETVWEPGVVTDLLAKTGAERTRPEGLEAIYGLGDDGYRLSEQQAQAILDLRLHRLTGLEQEKIVDEYREIVDRISELAEILASSVRLMEVIREELVDLRERYADARRTEIVDQHVNLSLEDLITEEDMVVTLSHAGYAKIQALDMYRAQRRGGRGRSATTMKDEDFIDRLFIANTHDTILCFSSLGRVYWLKVYELPQASRVARGKPIINLLPLADGERINTILPVRDFGEDRYVFFATSRGTVKKTPLADFSRPRSTGIIAINLDEGDYLVNATLTDGRRDVMLLSNAGKAIRFNEEDVRSMGRASRGVRGIRLKEGQQVISLIIVDPETQEAEGAGERPDCFVLTCTEHGYGKRTPVSEYPRYGRGGQGVISIRTTERNGDVVSAVLVREDDEAMMISDVGTLVRTPVSGISIIGRNTQGVTLMSLDDGARVVGVERVDEVAEPDAESDGAEEGGEPAESQGDTPAPQAEPDPEPDA